MKIIFIAVLLLLFNNSAHAREAFLYPQPGTTYTLGDTVEVDFDVPPGDVGEGVLFAFSDGKMHQIKAPGPYRFSFPLDQGIGKLKITAMTSSRTSKNYVAETYIVIEPVPNSFVQLRAEPDTMFMDQIPLQSQLNARAYLKDGSSINVTMEEAGTVYTVRSGTTTVIKMGPNGLVEAMGEGADIIDITTGG